MRKLSLTQANNQYYLQDTIRGAKIITIDGQRHDGDENEDVLPTPIVWRDADNKFFDVKDAITVDAHHYYAGVVYDYFKEKHGRNSYDRKGGRMYSYANMGNSHDASNLKT